MFAVIYRAFIFPEKVTEYQRLWRDVACFFVDQRGALGSTLHRTEDGQWVAYSRWPDRKTRDASWSTHDVRDDLPLEMQHTIANLKLCIDRDQPYEEICMEVVDQA